jgi:hypothetical protein
MFNPLDRSQRQPSKRANKFDIHFVSRQIDHYNACGLQFLSQIRKDLGTATNRELERERE